MSLEDNQQEMSGLRQDQVRLWIPNWPDCPHEDQCFKVIELSLKIRWIPKIIYYRQQILERLAANKLQIKTIMDG